MVLRTPADLRGRITRRLRAQVTRCISAFLLGYAGYSLRGRDDVKLAKLLHDYAQTLDPRLP